MVKDVNGQILRDGGVEVRRRWAEYFEQVLNLADVREIAYAVANVANCQCSWQLADADVGRFE